jgi:hypothetical protein
VVVKSIGVIGSVRHGITAPMKIGGEDAGFEGISPEVGKVAQTWYGSSRCRGADTEARLTA